MIDLVHCKADHDMRMEWDICRCLLSSSFVFTLSHWLYIYYVRRAWLKKQASTCSCIVAG